MLTPDPDVISCHKSGKATWKVGRENRRYCSICGSVHPQDFADILATGEGLVTGWEWESGVVSHCETVYGPFHARHLRDQSVSWLDRYITDIALSTGVVFYWEGELFRLKSFIGKRALSQEDALKPSVVYKIREFLAELD